MGIVLLRASAVWVAILALEVVHGVLRTMLLLPIVGDWRARQIGVAIGSLLILLVAWLTIRWIGARTRSETLGVGLLWLVAMLVAEVTLGRSVFGYEWSRIAEDFNLARGGLLGNGMAVLLIAPWLAARWRGVNRD
jgi:hypothetical protein